jgi:hypothetical protein
MKTCRQGKDLLKNFRLMFIITEKAPQEEARPKTVAAADAIKQH